MISQFLLRDMYGNIRGSLLSNLGLAEGSPLSPILINIITRTLHKVMKEDVKLIQYENVW